jgi:hypothetical protein
VAAGEGARCEIVILFCHNKLTIRRLYHYAYGKFYTPLRARLHHFDQNKKRDWKPPAALFLLQKNAKIINRIAFYILGILLPN